MKSYFIIEYSFIRKYSLCFNAILANINWNDENLLSLIAIRYSGWDIKRFLIDETTFLYKSFL